MRRREVAWRITSYELRECRRVHVEEGEKTVKYAVSPFGALINRIYHVGALYEIDSNEDKTMYKCKVADPLGIMNIYVSKYQPDAISFLRSLGESEYPKIVAFVAKVRPFEPEEGKTIFLVKPEWIKEVTIDLRNYWIVEAISQSLNRLELIEKIKERVASSDEVNEEVLEEVGVPEYWKKSFLTTFEYFSLEEINTDAFRSSLKDGLGMIYKILEEELAAPEEEEEGDLEKIVVETVKSLDSGEGAPWEEVVEALVRKTGYSRNDVEEILGEMLEDGVLYEPSLNYLKVAEERSKRIVKQFLPDLYYLYFLFHFSSQSFHHFLGIVMGIHNVNLVSSRI